MKLLTADEPHVVLVQRRRHDDAMSAYGGRWQRDCAVNRLDHPSERVQDDVGRLDVTEEVVALAVPMLGIVAFGDTTDEATAVPWS